MSRDAKVGLVIVFAFVFLLGTILVHRFHLTDFAQLAGGGETTAVDPDANSPVGDAASDENSPGSTDSNAITTVNARPAEDLNPSPSGGRMIASFDSSIAGSQRLPAQPSSTRPPVDVSDTSESGAHITLTDPRDEQPSAAVVESGSSTSRNLRGNPSINGQPIQTETPDTRPDSNHRSPPLLEISHGPSVIQRTARDMPDSEAAVPSTAGEVDSVDPKDSAPSQPVAVTDPSQSEPASMVETPPGRNIPPLNRPPSLEPDDDPADMDPGKTSIRQAADKRRPDPEEPSPPKLPKYGEPPQATIESVTDRDSRTLPRGADRSADATESLSPPNRTPPPRSSQLDATQVAGQRTYVVKEGDSFWSISARQYGTGKYFRALEEYNKDRLSTSGSAGKVLRPGTVIALPDESQLQSNSARKKPVEPASTKSRKFDAPKEASSFDSPVRRDTGLAPKRDVSSPPGTYRVKEGDTLSTIALRELGTSKRWQEIFRLNRDMLPDEFSLKVGMDLKMPPTSTAEKAAGRPNF